MKKIFIPIFVIAALSITSCRKSRTCSCTQTSTYTNGSFSSSSTSTSSNTYGHITKREITGLGGCMSRTETTVNGTGTTTDVFDCSVK